MLWNEVLHWELDWPFKNTYPKVFKAMQRLRELQGDPNYSEKVNELRSLLREFIETRKSENLRKGMEETFPEAVAPLSDRFLEVLNSCPKEISEPFLRLWGHATWKH